MNPNLVSEDLHCPIESSKWIGNISRKSEIVGSKVTRPLIA